MVASTAATFTSYTSYTAFNILITINVLVGFDLAATQDHPFRINVYDDYSRQQPPQEQKYRDDPYENRYQDRYQDRYPDQYLEPYPTPYQERHEVPYKKPVVPKKKSKDEQDFSKIPGTPGVDFPIYHTVPPTSFSCSKVPYLPGMYANVETGCQAYHTCHDGREGDQGAAFLCSNGTLFNQNEFACDWWYNVNCNDAVKLYRLNGDAVTNPFVPKAKKDEIIRDRLKIVVF